MEGTGSYGAGLARHLRGQGPRIVEVDRPDRRMRRQQGKSDPADAVAAARAVQAGTATGTPKARDGVVESIRALRVARHGAIKSHTAADQRAAADAHHRRRRTCVSSSRDSARRHWSRPAHGCGQAT